MYTTQAGGDNITSSSTKNIKKDVTKPVILELNKESLEFKNKFNTLDKIHKRKIITQLLHKHVTYKDYKPEFITYDIETYQGVDNKAEPYLIGLYSPTMGYKEFWGAGCVDKALAFILKLKAGKNKKLTFCAHNAGMFDNYFLINSLTKLDNSVINLQCMVDAFNSVFYMEFKHKGITFVFNDTYKRMPLSLAKLMKDLGVSVLSFNTKLPFNHSWVNESRLDYKGVLPD